MSTIVLIDGEHYPQVTARAIDQLKLQGEPVVMALLVGGSEKLGQVALEIGVPVEVAGEDREIALAAAIETHHATRVLDLSDEPVLGYVARCRMASVALFKGAAYVGADFLFTPPPRPRLCEAPSVAIMGTGKRTGKTAIAGVAARALSGAGFDPIIVAMGRGGPAEPEVIEAGTSLDAKTLLARVEAGGHGASDHIEDALFTGVTTVGAYRAGGGLAGAISFSNYHQAVAMGNRLKPGLMLLEGSGASIPPVHSDASVFIIDAQTDPAEVYGYFGLYRLLLADLVVITMVEESIDSQRLLVLEQAISSGSGSRPKVIHTIFRPTPLGDVSGKKVWYATTAPEEAGPLLTQHLEDEHGAKVVGISHSLADRPSLRTELAKVTGVDAFLVEVKAAAVDVVTRFGLEHGTEVIYCDNRPIDVGSQSLSDEILDVAETAKRRFRL
ncbi:MAG: 2,3-diphosphoglycerate synthetase [Actinomycetota bacterium]